MKLLIELLCDYLKEPAKGDHVGPTSTTMAGPRRKPPGHALEPFPFQFHFISFHCLFHLNLPIPIPISIASASLSNHNHTFDSQSPSRTHHLITSSPSKQFTYLFNSQTSQPAHSPKDLQQLQEEAPRMHVSRLGCLSAIKFCDAPISVNVFLRF